MFDRLINEYTVTDFCLCEWIEEAVRGGCLKRETKWSEALAVGSTGFVEQIEQQLGVQARGRKIKEDGEAYVLREPDAAYDAHLGAEKVHLSMDNSVFFDESIEGSIC